MSTPFHVAVACVNAEKRVRCLTWVMKRSRMMKGLQAATPVTLVFHPFALLFSSCQSLLHLGANPSSRRAVRPHRVLLKELVVETLFSLV